MWPCRPSFTTSTAPSQLSQWTIAGYALAQAAMIPLAGWALRPIRRQTDLLHPLRRTVHQQVGVLLHQAQSDTWLIAFHVYPGWAAGLCSIAMAYVYELSPPERVGAVMGIMGIPILLAPAIGPVLAGWLVHCRGLSALDIPARSAHRADRRAAGHAISPKSRTTRSQCWTWQGRYGAARRSVALSSLSPGAQLDLKQHDWRPRRRGRRTCAFFTVVGLRSPQPVTRFARFPLLFDSVSPSPCNRSDSSRCLVLLSSCLLLQQVRHYRASNTAFSFCPALADRADAIGGTLFDRIGARPLVVVGRRSSPSRSRCSTSIGLTTQGTDLVLPLLLSGAGMGLMMIALNTHLINAAARRARFSRVTSLTKRFPAGGELMTVAALATILSLA